LVQDSCVCFFAIGLRYA